MVLSPMTWPFVSSRRKPSIVSRQNSSAASSIDAYQRDAGTCCGCWSQLSASQTLMSIKYEVIGGFGIRALRSGPALSPEQRQPNPLAGSRRMDRGDAGNRLAAFGDDDSFRGQILQQREAPTAELGDAEISHDQSVHQNVQLRECQPIRWFASPHHEYPGNPRRVLNRFGDTTNGQPVPLGKPWDRQPNSGKLRRKLVSVPGLRRPRGQLSPKRLSTPLR